MTERQRLVLASQSPARLRLLRDAGFLCDARPSAVDEDAMKASLRAEGAGVADAALALASAKAAKIDAPSALVIAADQMLSCDDSWLDKPVDRRAAAAQIDRLSGRAHELVVGAVVYEDGREIWRVVARASLQMRVLTPEMIEAYLDAAGPAALDSVGGYAIEGVGARLFTKIDGDSFTIQGLPLIQLSNFLVDRGHWFLPI